MKQDRYVIFTSDELGLETYLGSGAEAKRVELGNTPEAIAESMKTLGISSNDDIYYSSGMEFGTEVGFKTDEALIELFEKACNVYVNMLTSNQ